MSSELPSKVTSTQRWVLWRWPDNDSKWCWLVDLPSADIPSGAVDVTPVMLVSEHEAIAGELGRQVNALAPELERLREAALTVLPVIAEQVQHRFMGECPEPPDYLDNRDPECGACRGLDLLRAALAPANREETK